MPRLCDHSSSVNSIIDGVVTRICTGCIEPVGTRVACETTQIFDAEGYIHYHSFPPPTRMVCRGSKHSSKEDAEVG